MERTVTNEARRAQIVQAAIRTLAEVGYAKASFARITQQAGLSSPRMISYHFADKDDLMHQVAVEVMTAGARYIHERVEQEQGAAARLRAYLEANLRFLYEHPAEIAALTAVGPYLRDSGGEAYTSRTAREPSVQGLEALLADGQRSGEFRQFDVRSMAVLIRGAVDAASAQFHAPEALDLATYTHEVVTTVALATAATPAR